MPSRGNAARKEKPRPIEGEILMDEKTARRVRLTRWRRLLTGLAVGLLVGGSVGLYVSPLLRVQDMEVVGATAVGRDEVLSLTRLDGDSMMRLDLAAAERRVESIPMVQSAARTALAADGTRGDQRTGALGLLADRPGPLCH